jgi:hypothetical protein
MSSRLSAFLVVVITAAILPAGSRAGVIFSNSPGSGGTTSTSAAQLGEEVTGPPNTSRTVTQLLIGYTDNGIPATANLQAFLYANDGAGGAPGTLLWSSSILTNVSITSTDQLVSFAVPSIVVPDSFTFTSSTTNTTGVFYVPATGASVGTFDQAWVGSPGAFSTLTGVFETEAQVITGSVAVPEPSSVALVLAGLVATLALRRIRRSAGVPSDFPSSLAAKM